MMLHKDTAKVLIGLAISALWLGCGSSTFHYPVPEKNGMAGSFVMKLGEFKTESKTYAADFGTITVQENRENPGSRLIHLPLIRIRSHSNLPLEPVFGFTGGPGMTNLKWMPSDALLAEHDFVMVGYRGVDGSSVLDCPEVTEALKTDEDVLSEESLRRIADAWRKSAKRFAESGVDLDGYVMTEVVEDVEQVRKQFGYKSINVLSESYGTRVAYISSLMHPESIHRSVMIGVNPPGHFVWDPRIADAQLSHYARLWSLDPDMSARSADLVETIRNVVGNMPRKWLFFTINPGKVKAVTFALLFNRNTAAMVFDAYVAAQEGDASGLALMSMAYDFVVPALFTWGELASKAVSADFDTSRNYAQEMIPQDAVLGAPLSKLLWGPLGYAGWPIRQLPARFRTLQKSEVQTLLLSGSVDFSTPAEFATKELMPFLPNGRQIVLPELGHVADVWKVNTQSTERLLTSFFRTGIPDTSLTRHVPIDFQVDWGFPRLAKVALGTGFALIVAIIAGIVWWSR